MAASYNPTVNVTWEIAPGDDVLDTTPTWVDISSSVRQFTIVQGRSRVLDQMQAGRAIVTLSNASANFNPANTAGAYYPNLTLFTQIRCRVTYNSITYDRFRGYVTAWPQTYPSGGKDATVVLDCVDAFALFAMREKQFSHGVVASGTRIDGLLNQISWPAGWKSLDAGIHNVAALDLEFSSILEEIHRTVLVEQGLFYINGAGLAVFKDGNTRIQDKTSVVATFADDGTNIGYEDLNVSFDDTQLWNDVTVSRTDGVSQNVFDATSVNADGEHDLHLSDTLNVSDGEAYALAGWLLLQHKEMIPRAPSITFRPEKSPATAWPVSLGLDYLDRIRVKRTAIAGDDIDVEFHLEGVTQDVRMVGGRSWATTFQLSPVLPFNDWWILGTSQLGSARIGY